MFGLPIIHLSGLIRVAGSSLSSVRVLFSIADIDSTQDDPEFAEEGAESEEAQVEHGFPVRVGITITKVSYGSKMPAFCGRRN